MLCQNCSHDQQYCVRKPELHVFVVYLRAGLQLRETHQRVR